MTFKLTLLFYYSFFLIIHHNILKNSNGFFSIFLEIIIYFFKYIYILCKIKWIIIKINDHYHKTQSNNIDIIGFEPKNEIDSDLFAYYEKKKDLNSIST